MSETFTAKVGDKEVVLCVRLPTDQDHREADKVRNKTVREAVDDGAMFSKKLEHELKKQGIWGDQEEAELKAIEQEIADITGILTRKGGIKLSEGKTLAFRSRDLRAKKIELMSERNSLEKLTAEAQGENARFNYLVSVCLVYNDTGKPFYKNYADYLNNSNSFIAGNGASILARLMYGLSENFEDELPENAFLKKFKMVNDLGQLINKDGHAVDEEGRLIDKNNRYIDAEGNFINKYGDRVDEQGNLIEKPVFLDDDGQPIVE